MVLLVVEFRVQVPAGAFVLLQQVAERDPSVIAQGLVPVRLAVQVLEDVRRDVPAPDGLGSTFRARSATRFSLAYALP
jgi:hypothetical protein